MEQRAVLLELGPLPRVGGAFAQVLEQELAEPDRLVDAMEVRFRRVLEVDPHGSVPGGAEVEDRVVSETASGVLGSTREPPGLLHSGERNGVPCRWRTPPDPMPTAPPVINAHRCRRPRPF